MTVQATRRSNRWPWIVVVVALLVLIPIIALLLAGGREEEPSPTAAPTASPTPIPTEEALNQELLNNRLTVLFVGLDSNEARQARGEGVNADAILLVSISADQSEMALVSLPRDTVDVPLPDGGEWSSKVNALYASEGIDFMTDVMAELYQVEIDGHVVLDMDDFATIVEAVGGITVDPEAPLTDPPIGLDLEAGEQEIDGETALSYVRTRVDQDYGRMGRQQEVIQEIVAELVDEEADVDLTELMAGLESLETDLPVDELRTFLEIGRRAQDADVTEVVIRPPLIVFEGDRGDGRGYILEPDVDAIRERVAELITDE